MSDVIEKNINDYEVSLIDLLIILAKNKKLLILIPLCAGIVAAVGSFMLPNIYTADAKVMPPQQSGSSAAAMLSQIGGSLGGLAGGALGVKNSGDLYIGLFKSRTISDRLIAKFQLQKRYRAKSMAAARIFLQKATNITSGKDSLISLEFSDTDPKFAANVANAYVEELDALLKTIAVTEASRRRLYFEKQLQRTKDDLAVAEVALRQTQERTGLIDPGTQGKALIESIATLRAQIASREVTLGAMKSFATDMNPDAIQIRGEIEELQKQLNKVEKPVAEVEGRGDTTISSGKVPELGLEYARKLRDMKYHEILFELMAKQYEMAKADEARDSDVLQVVDKSVPPDQKDRPRRGQITIGAVLFCFVITAIWLVLFDLRKKRSVSDMESRKYEELKAALKF